MIRLIRPIIILLIFGMLAYWINLKYDRVGKVSHIFVSKNTISNTGSLVSGDFSKTGSTAIIIDSGSILSGNTETGFVLINTGDIYTGKKIVDLENSGFNQIFDNNSGLAVNSGNTDKISDCVFRDKIIKNGSYIIAYRQKYTNNCDYQKRYCDNGKLGGEYIYDTCIYGNMESDNAANDNMVNNGLDSSVLTNSNKSDNPANIKNNKEGNQPGNSKNSNQNTKMTDDYDQVNVYIDQFVNNYPTDSSKGNGSSGSTSSNGGKIDIKTSLDNRKNNVDKVMNDTRTSTPKTLEQYVGMMSSINDHSNSKGNNTTTQPKINNNSTTSKTSKGCLTPRGTNINNGQSIVAYNSPATTFPKSCEFETRYCSNGVLDGTYKYQNCEFGQLTYQTKFDATSYYIYSDNSSIYYPNYLSKNIGSSFYLLNSNNMYNANISKKGCWIDNIYVPSGETKTFYKSNTVSRGSYCSSINRTCNDGSMGGDVSYSNVYCRQLDPVSCRAPVYNIYIPHGSSKPYYKSNSGSCIVDYRYCNNGVLGGSLTGTTNCLIK